MYILHKLGFSTGYNEAQLFEASCMKSTPPTILSDSFMQFVFDKADFDVHTIDGFHTTIQSEEEIMDELEIPSCDTNDSDTEESIEDNQHITDHESEDEKQ